MITFNVKDEKFLNIDILDSDIKFFELNFKHSTITNKYNIITNFIENISRTLGDDFDVWFKNFLLNYQNINTNDEESRFEYLEKRVHEIKTFVDLYFEKINISFDRFVDASKVKKNSILFTPDEIKKILLLSNYLKIYSLIFNSPSLKLDSRLHKRIFDILSSDIVKNNNEIISKILYLVQTKTYSYKLSDRYMWEYIKNLYCKSIDDHAIELFNFIMNSILVLCEENKNPIIFFVTVTDESIKWVLRSVYKNTISYSDSISTEDVHGLNVDNLRTYSYNDTLGRLKEISLGYLFGEINGNNIDDKEVTTLQDRLNKVEFHSPLLECVVYPVLSKITNIPYIHFKTLSPLHSIVISSYLYNVLRKVFKNQYKNIFSLLNYYPVEYPSVSTTYSMKNVNEFIDIQNKTKNFYGFNTKVYPIKIVNHFIGRIARIPYVNIQDGTVIRGIPLQSIESELTQFLLYLCADKFESELEEIKNLIIKDF